METMSTITSLKAAVSWSLFICRMKAYYDVADIHTDDDYDDADKIIQHEERESLS